MDYTYALQGWECFLCPKRHQYDGKGSQRCQTASCHLREGMPLCLQGGHHDQDQDETADRNCVPQAIIGQQRHGACDATDVPADLSMKNTVKQENDQAAE